MYTNSFFLRTFSKPKYFNFIEKKDISEKQNWKARDILSKVLFNTL